MAETCPKSRLCPEEQQHKQGAKAPPRLTGHCGLDFQRMRPAWGHRTWAVAQGSVGGSPSGHALAWPAQSAVSSYTACPLGSCHRCPLFCPEAFPGLSTQPRQGMGICLRLSQLVGHPAQPAFMSETHEVTPLGSPLLCPTCGDHTPHLVSCFQTYLPQVHMPKSTPEISSENLS